MNNLQLKKDKESLIEESEVQKTQMQTKLDSLNLKIEEQEKLHSKEVKRIKDLFSKKEDSLKDEIESMTEEIMEQTFKIDKFTGFIQNKLRVCNVDKFIALEDDENIMNSLPHLVDNIERKIEEKKVIEVEEPVPKMESSTQTAEVVVNPILTTPNHLNSSRIIEELESKIYQLEDQFNVPSESRYALKKIETTNQGKKSVLMDYSLDNINSDMSPCKTAKALFQKKEFSSEFKIKKQHKEVATSTVKENTDMNVFSFKSDLESSSSNSGNENPFKTSIKKDSNEDNFEPESQHLLEDTKFKEMSTSPSTKRLSTSILYTKIEGSNPGKIKTLISAQLKELVKLIDRKYKQHQSKCHPHEPKMYESCRESSQLSLTSGQKPFHQLQTENRHYSDLFSQIMELLKEKSEQVQCIKFDDRELFIKTKEAEHYKLKMKKYKAKLTQIQEEKQKMANQNSKLDYIRNYNASQKSSIEDELKLRISQLEAQIQSKDTQNCWTQTQEEVLLEYSERKSSQKKGSELRFTSKCQPSMVPGEKENYPKMNFSNDPFQNSISSTLKRNEAPLLMTQLTNYSFNSKTTQEHFYREIESQALIEGCNDDQTHSSGLLLKLRVQCVSLVKKLCRVALEQFQIAKQVEKDLLQVTKLAARKKELLPFQIELEDIRESHGSAGILEEQALQFRNQESIIMTETFRKYQDLHRNLSSTYSMVTLEWRGRKADYISWNKRLANFCDRRIYKSRSSFGLVH